MTAPKVLFLPGASGSATFWHPVGARLPDPWEKVYLSWPGLGAEPPSPAVRGFADCVGLVERHLDRPCDLVAQSMGGIVAVQVAARNPGLVRRLVLCATSGGVDVTALGAVYWRAAYHADHPAAARWISDEHPDVSAEVESLRLPTLLLWGADDPISPVAVGEHLRQLIRDSELHVIAGGTHSFAHDEPDQVARLISMTHAPR